MLTFRDEPTRPVATGVAEGVDTSGMALPIAPRPIPVFLEMHPVPGLC